MTEINRYLKDSAARLKSTWSYRLLIEQKYTMNARKGIQQGTRKLVDSTSANLKSMAGLLSSKVFDRLSVERSKLNVAQQSIRSGALNEIKIQNRDLSGRINRFQIDRILQVIDQGAESTAKQDGGDSSSGSSYKFKAGFFPGVQGERPARKIN